ncbi:MAG: polysaccharide biosynthesis tyrosine autokinase [Bryobacteraceae bacterium]
MDQPNPSTHLPVPAAGQPGLPSAPADLRPPRAGEYPGYPPFLSEKPGDSAHSGLLEYWRILQRRKGTLVLCSFLAGLAACLYTFPQTPIYQAHALIEIQSMNENFLNMREVNPTTDTTMYYPEYDLQTQVRVLQSRTLLERVDAKLKNHPRPPAPAGSRLDAWRRAMGLPDSKPTAQTAADVRVRAQVNTRLIDISCDSNDPRYAADFVNTLTAEYIEQNLESRWQTTQSTGAWLARQMEDVRIKLERSDAELQNYARMTGLLFTSEKNNLAEERLRQLQDELSKAQADRVGKQSRYELASSASIDSLPDVVDDATVRDQYSKLLELRRQRADLATSYTPAHPRVKRLQSQIAETEASLIQQREMIVRRIRNDFEAARRRETLLAAVYGAQARLMTEQADKVTHYNILKREVDTNRQLYDSMLQRVKEAGIASTLRASNVRVVEPATVPGAPYKPDVVHNTLLGLLAGLAAGVAFVVLRDRADRTLQEPGDAAFYLNVSELGVIPSYGAELRRERRLLPWQAHKPGDEMALVTWRRKPSALAESFRGVLTSIMFAGLKHGRPQVIVLSSANPTEGKTSIATNLAVALAEISQRVLLIDADLRRPRLHQIFELDNKAGLATILRAKNGPASSNGLIQTTDVPGLHVLPTGADSVSASALLYSPRMAELLRGLRTEFDTILIDTPPMLQMPDGRILGRLADGVILVIRANATTRDAALAARQRLSEDGTPILGAILNDWNPKHSVTYGYYGYKYYDHYHRQDAKDRASDEQH